MSTLWFRFFVWWLWAFNIIGFILGTPIYAAIYTLIGKRVRNNIADKGKIAQEALDFDVLQYTQIAEEQKKLRTEKEQEQREKLKKRLHLDKILENDKRKRSRGEEEAPEETASEETEEQE